MVSFLICVIGQPVDIGQNQAQNYFATTSKRGLMSLDLTSGGRGDIPSTFTIIIGWWTSLWFRFISSLH